MDLNAPSADDVSRVLQWYQNQVRIIKTVTRQFSRPLSALVTVVSPQSGLDSEKPFVLEKHMSDIDR